MPRIRTAEGATEIQTNSFDVRFLPIEPGQYLARVVSVEQGFFTAKSGQKYMKLRPHVVIFNESNTTVSNQDIVVGAVNDDGVLYQPDAKKRAEGVSAVWSPALFFFGALGFERDEDFAPELVTGQVVTVSIINEEYETREGKKRVKNTIGYRKPDGQVGSGFFRVNPEKDAEEIERLGLFEEAGMWWASETDLEDYYAALEKLESGVDEADDDIL